MAHAVHKNWGWRIWSVPCVLTRPVQTLAYYQERVSFWISCLEGLFYISDVVIMFWSYEYWLLLLECTWDQARHQEIHLFKRLHRQWALIDQDDYLLIMVIFLVIMFHHS